MAKHIQHSPPNVVAFTSREGGRAALASGVNRYHSKNKQLELGLEAQRAVILVATDHIHGAFFQRLLFSFRPFIVLDLRYAPHFSFPGLPSSVSRHAIQKVGAQYVLHSTRAHGVRPHLADNGTNVIQEWLNAVYRDTDPKGPLMVLVQHRADAEKIAPLLANALSRIEGGVWDAHVSG